MDRDLEPIRDMLNKIAGQLPIMERLLIELAGQIALTMPDPHGFLERMCDRAEQDARNGYSIASTKDALHYSIEFIENLRAEFSRLEQ